MRWIWECAKEQNGSRKRTPTIRILPCDVSSALVEKGGAYGTRELVWRLSAKFGVLFSVSVSPPILCAQHRRADRSNLPVDRGHGKGLVVLLVHDGDHFGRRSPAACRFMAHCSENPLQPEYYLLDEAKRGPSERVTICACAPRGRFNDKPRPVFRRCDLPAMSSSNLGAQHETLRPTPETVRVEGARKLRRGPG